VLVPRDGARGGGRVTTEPTEPTEPAELVVLVDDDGAPAGVADKRTVHGPDTPLHLAFSCYVFDGARRVLVTRRAFGKLTWPGTRTNSACGHPGPGEPVAEAVARRLRDELGIERADLELLLPRFRYRSTMADGTVEHELCPVYRAVVPDDVAQRFRGEDDPPFDPLEVADAWWQPWPEFLADAADAGDPLSPWARLQLPALTELGPDPARWSPGDPADLPAAARG
jgi:isopentenyl-diphosphate delta-isomerase